MRSSLAPVLANNILTELENIIVKKLVDEDMIKFYIRYVEDTLLLMKREDIDRVHKVFESFDKKLHTITLMMIHCIS